MLGAEFTTAAQAPQTSKLCLPLLPLPFPLPSSLILAVSRFQFYDLQRVDNSFICFLRVIIGRISASAIALGAVENEQQERHRKRESEEREGQGE